MENPTHELLASAVKKLGPERAAGALTAFDGRISRAWENCALSCAWAEGGAARLIDRAQWELFQETGHYGTRWWTIQGDQGVPVHVIESPDSITTDEIKNEQNAEVRRCMIARMGAEKYVKAIGAKRVQADDYGELYRVKRGDDSDLVMVRCFNSTPEPGTTSEFKEYWLRVHPESKSAREGLGRMIGLRDAKQYAPALET